MFELMMMGSGEEFEYISGYSPGDVEVGDLLFLLQSRDDGAPPPTPSGFTTVLVVTDTGFGNTGARISCKTATASDVGAGFPAYTNDQFLFRSSLGLPVGFEMGAINDYGTPYNPSNGLPPYGVVVVNTRRDTFSLPSIPSVSNVGPFLDSFSDISGATVGNGVSYRARVYGGGEEDVTINSASNTYQSRLVMATRT